MLFPQPLRRGRLLARYKRFFADVVLDDEGPVTAHVANSGKMLGLLDPGNVCWLSRSDAPGRKLPWTLEMVEEPTGALVGVNTMLPNRLAAEAITAGRIPELSGYASLRREVRYGVNSRIDLLLGREGLPPCGMEAKPSQPSERCWVEVKSVTLSRTPGLAEWPDCVSSRTTRQLAELRDLVADGDRAVLLFLVQRSDCARFAPAADLDPVFAAELDKAVGSGVEALCYSAEPTPTGVGLGRALAFA